MFQPAISSGVADRPMPWWLPAAYFCGRFCHRSGLLADRRRAMGDVLRLADHRRHGHGGHWCRRIGPSSKRMQPSPNRAWRPNQSWCAARSFGQCSRQSKSSVAVRGEPGARRGLRPLGRDDSWLSHCRRDDREAAADSGLVFLRWTASSSSSVMTSSRLGRPQTLESPLRNRALRPAWH